MGSDGEKVLPGRLLAVMETAASISEIDLLRTIIDTIKKADALVTESFPDLYELPLRLGRKLNEGFSDKLQDLGFSTTEYRMEEGLLH